MEKKINVQENLNTYLELAYTETGVKIPDKYMTYLVAAQISICKKILGLAAENVFYEEMLSEETDSGCTYVAVINRDSILNTINQLE